MQQNKLERSPFPSHLFQASLIYESKARWYPSGAQVPHSKWPWTEVINPVENFIWGNALAYSNPPPPPDSDEEKKVLLLSDGTTFSHLTLGDPQKTTIPPYSYWNFQVFLYLDWAVTAWQLFCIFTAAENDRFFFILGIFESYCSQFWSLLKTRLYNARLCKAMQGYARLCKAMQGYARLCKAMQGYARQD